MKKMILIIGLMSISLTTEAGDILCKGTLKISDSAEYPQDRLNKNLLDMPLIKAANSSSSALTRKEAREIFGFNESHRVVSLYMHVGLSKSVRHSPDLNPNFVEVSNRLIHENYRTVFLTYTLLISALVKPDMVCS